MTETEYSCVDCSIAACNKRAASFPKFCPTAALADEKLAESTAAYATEDHQRILKASAQAMSTPGGNKNITHIQATIEFAKALGAKKLGIATCLNLMEESRVLTKILRSHGFEVYGLCCKIGAQTMDDLCAVPEPNHDAARVCNPILQARLLNEAETDLNIVMGLCVGHDSLFYKHAEAPITTLVTKDRLTGHNPVAPLYTLDSCYHSLYGKERKL